MNRCLKEVLELEEKTEEEDLRLEGIVVVWVWGRAGETARLVDDRERWEEEALGIGGLYVCGKPGSRRQDGILILC